MKLYRIQSLIFLLHRKLVSLFSSGISHLFQSHQNGTEIDVATQLWINPVLMTSPNYVSALRNYYGTDIQQLNFGDANVAASTINTWVRQQTRNNIKSIIQPGI